MFEGQLLYRFVIYWSLSPKKKLYYEPAIILKYQMGYYTALLSNGVEILKTVEFLSEEELMYYKNNNNTDVLPMSYKFLR